jgi:hypothetical protein
MELWGRIKTHIQAKERLEVADIFIDVFDEFGMLDDSILGEDLDKELRAATRSRLVNDEEIEGYEDSDDDYSF